jgi:hypothetical protein
LLSAALSRSSSLSRRATPSILIRASATNDE